MKIAKWIFASALLLLGAIFYEPILEAGIGLSAKGIIRWKMGTSFSYRCIDWQKRKIVFSDICLSPIRAEKGSIEFDWSEFPRRLKGHIEVDHPVVSIHDRIRWKPSKWLAFSLSIQNGRMTIPEMGEAQFSYEEAGARCRFELYRIQEGFANLGSARHSKIDPKEEGHSQVGKADEKDRFYKVAASSNPQNLTEQGIERDHSLFVLNGIDEGGVRQFDLNLKTCNASFLKSLAGSLGFKQLDPIEVESGLLDGWVHLFLEKGLVKQASIHMEVANLSARFQEGQLDEVDGRLDWEQSTETFSPLLGGLPPAELQGRLRVSIDHLNFRTPSGAIESLQGDISYNPGMGAKWEIRGLGKAGENLFPFDWEGRGYFHKQMAHWVEMAFQFEETESRISIKGRQQDAKQIWGGECKELCAEQFSWMKSLMDPFLSPSIKPWNFNKGVLQIEAAFSFFEKEVDSWVVSRICGKEVAFENGQIQISSDQVEAHFSKDWGDIALAEAKFQLKLANGERVEGNQWTGNCAWNGEELKPSHFAGCLQGVETEIVLSGLFSEWKARTQLSGLLTGSLDLTGGIEEGRLPVGIEGNLEGMALKGVGWFASNGNFSLSIDQFSGNLDWLAHVWPSEKFSGYIDSVGNGFQLQGNRTSVDWTLRGRVSEAALLSSYCNLGGVSFHFDASPNEFNCLKVRGEWVTSKGKMAFQSPYFRKVGSDWAFDFRVVRPTWDLLRLSGNSDGTDVIFDKERSHFLGAPIQLERCSLDQGQLKGFDLQFQLPWTSVLAAVASQDSPGVSLNSFHGSTAVQLHYNRDGGSEISVQGIDFCWKETPLNLDFHALEQTGSWHIDRFQIADFQLSCFLKKEEEFFHLLQGKGESTKGIATRFEGKITPDFHSEIFLSEVQLDLDPLGTFVGTYIPLQPMNGKLCGGGRCTYDGEIECELDLVASPFKVGSIELENRDPIHLYYSSNMGAIFRGLDLQISPSSSALLSKANCKIELLQYDPVRSHWILNHSYVHLPKEMIPIFQSQVPLLQNLDIQYDLNFWADIDCASDFSTLTCSVKEGEIPYNGASRHVEDLSLFWNKKECHATFHYIHQMRPIYIDLNLDFELAAQERSLQSGEAPSIQEEGLRPHVIGRVMLQAEKGAPRPLIVDWEYGEGQGVFISSIEGSFSGLEASFHRETNPHSNQLIGSARFDCEALVDFVPESLARCFTQLKMGKGYELKGRLTIEKEDVSFKGILSGKQVELFGCQFRTLLAQAELSPRGVHIFDLKISDTAGMLKMEELLLQGSKEVPWTLSIPHLTLQDFRPSLLQKVGQEVGPISPLVVRELKLSDFKGLAEDSRTFTARGELSFINSYKREYTVLDLPADVLSRIVGLDLELLVPVRGALRFDLKDRLIRIQELKDCFSEADRSEFYLVEEPFASMDLDGNLKILIKMKQHVLFKLTEAFLISINGDLANPHFSLEKKSRFFGL